MNTAPTQEAMASVSDAVTILYRNWRGEVAPRRIVPAPGYPATWPEWFGSTEWHPEPQWLFRAFDIDKGAYRDFARSGVLAWGQEAVDAALATPAVPEQAKRVALTLLMTEAFDYGVRFADPERGIGDDHEGACRHAIDRALTNFCEHARTLLATPPSVRAGEESESSSVEALARSIAAEKIGSADPTGSRLPDDIWRQALPEARSRYASDEDDDLDRCGICDEPKLAGQLVLTDVELGEVHAACCGPERDSYVKNIDTGEPLGPDDPIPQGRPYEPDAAPTPASAGAVPEELRKLRDWLTARIEAAHADSEAHPQGSGNRAFYLGQAIAYENALSAAPAPEPAAAGQGDGWRPINTAPRDGREVDVFGGRYETPTAVKADGDWWNSATAKGLGGLPTHWRPRPKPPFEAPTSAEGR